MDTTTILLVPLLVLGVVMAFAFAGCGSFGAAEAPPETHPAPPPTPTPAPTPTPTPAPGHTQQPDAYPNLVMDESTKSLHGYWRLNDPGPIQPGITPAKDYDRANNPQDGKYQGGVTVGAEGVLRNGSDDNDVAARFNGTDAFVEFAYNAFLNPAADFTIEAWINPEPLTPGGSGVIVSSYTAAPVKRGIVLEVVQVDATTMNAQVRIGQAVANYGTVSVPLGAGSAIGGWRYVVATYVTQPSPVLSLFVLSGASAVNDHIPKPGQLNPNYKAVRTVDAPPFRIGAGWNEPTQTAPGLFFKGRIDEVAIYDKAMPVSDADPNVKFTIQKRYQVATTR